MSGARAGPVERSDGRVATASAGLPPPIGFRDQELRADKAFRVGTHRVRDPHDTFEIVEPFLAAAGVTRVADITGLDRVGVPTTLAIRPNSETIACSSGKGVSLDQAMTSGAMEAVELHAAETVELPTLLASHDELRGSYPVAAVELLPLTRWNLFSASWPVPWAMGWGLLAQRELPVPAALVGMSRRQAFVTNAGAFHVTSNGLGSGNSLLEAISAALYEVIERDALACTYAAAAAGRREVPIVAAGDLAAYPLVADVLDRCDRAGVVVTVYDCTVDTAVPTYNALAHEPDNATIGVVKGSGTHLDPEIAVLRAVTEALQARLNFIAGSRDDVFRSAYVRGKADHGLAVAAIMKGREESPAAQLSDSHPMATFEQDVAVLLERVRSVGVDQVVAFDITPDECPVSVVRIIVPGMEGYQNHGFRPGPRAVAAAEGAESSALSGVRSGAP